MFVYSHAQFQQLLGIDDSWMTENLIDLGKSSFFFFSSGYKIII